MVKAQHARQVLDVIVGYKISPILWKYLYNDSKNSLSSGRCQTPALRLVYDNELERKNKDKDKSYTSSLLSGGLSKCIDKMEEEFGELKEALNDKSNEVHEAADTIYHLLVTLEAANIKFEDVLQELENRKNQSGIEEKNNRK